MEQTVGHHLLAVRERLAEMADLVSVQGGRAQVNQKHAYDRSTKDRAFQEGQEVLVLLPRVGNPLKLEWAGPYKVLWKTSPVDYEIKTPGRRRGTKIVHVNLLKPWYRQGEPYMFAQMEQSQSDFEDTEGDGAFFPTEPNLEESKPDFKLGDHLSTAHAEGAALWCAGQIPRSV